MFDWIAAMQQRRSVRRFLPGDLSEEAVASLRMATESQEPLDEHVDVHVQLVPYEAVGSRTAVGAMAMVDKAPWYLVGRAAPQPGRMEELGFRMEQVILAATALGLGTCWIGGFYRAGELAERLGCVPEDILAISPVGLPSTGRRQNWTRAVIHGVSAHGGRRKPLEDFAFWQRWGEPVLRESVPPEMWQALEMAQASPSWSNLQPWYFLMTENMVLALGDSRPQRGNSRPDKPYYRLDVGIAMCHFWLTLHQLGYGGRWLSLRRQESLAHGALDVPEHVVPVGTLVL